VGAFGLVAMTTGGSAIAYGAMLVAAAAFWWTRQKTEWTVLLNTASGEMQALTSTDRRYIDGVIAALNNAIVHRG
jgi:hypothetical protein